MRHDPVSNVIHLAVRLQDTRSALTIDDIETEFNVSRRTGERLLDSVDQSFGPLEEVETGERRKCWRLRSDALRQLIRVAPEELAELESAAEGLDRAGLTERAKAIHEVAGKLRAVAPPPGCGDRGRSRGADMRTQGPAMRAGPRPHLEAGLLPLLRAALTAGFAVEFGCQETALVASASCQDVRSARLPSRAPRVTRKQEFSEHHRWTLSPCRRGNPSRFPNRCDTARCDPTERVHSARPCSRQLEQISSILRRRATGGSTSASAYVVSGAESPVKLARTLAHVYDAGVVE